jgi:phage gp16-like protein
MGDIKRYFSGQIPKETRFEIDEAKVKKVVSETLRKFFKKKLNEGNFYNPNENYELAARKPTSLDVG